MAGPCIPFSWTVPTGRKRRLRRRFAVGSSETFTVSHKPEARSALDDHLRSALGGGSTAARSAGGDVLTLSHLQMRPGWRGPKAGRWLN